MYELFTDLQSYFQELSPKEVLVQASPIEVSQHDNGIHHSFDKHLVGIAKANEMLIWGKKKEAQELLDCGFLKFAIFKSVLSCFTKYDLAVKSQQPVDQFHKEVQNLLRSELEGLESAAVLATKRLIKAGLNDSNDFDTVNLRESYGKHEVTLGSDNNFFAAQAERFASGIPFTQFARIAKKEIRHKL